VSDRRDDSSPASSDAEAGRDIPRGTDEHADSSSTSSKKRAHPTRDDAKREEPASEVDGES
jgi:hypothetical protein